MKKNSLEIMICFFKVLRDHFIVSLAISVSFFHLLLYFIFVCRIVHYIHHYILVLVTYVLKFKFSEITGMLNLFISSILEII